MEWPYTSFGTPTQPSSQTEIADLGTTLVTFPNGVKLTVKPTDLHRRTDSGERAHRQRPAWPADRSSQSRPLRLGAFSEGGLGKLTRSQLEQVLAGDVVGSQLRGRTRDTYSSRRYDPARGFRAADAAAGRLFHRPGLATRALRAGQGHRFRTQLDQIRATPGGAFGLESAGLLSSGDKRSACRRKEEIAAGELSDLRQVVSSSIAQRPDRDHRRRRRDGRGRHRQAVGETFGALPARSAASRRRRTRLRRRFPAPTPEPVQINHTGLPTQALAYVAWPTTDSIERPQGRPHRQPSGAGAAAARDRRDPRENRASPIRRAPRRTSSTVFPDYGYAFVQAEIPPESLPGFFETRR